MSQAKLIDIGGQLYVPAVNIDSLTYPSSTGNNSVAQLASNASFTGAIETILNLQSAQVEIVCDQPYTYTINQFIDAAGTQKSGSIVKTKAAGVPTNINVDLPGNYFQLIVKNTGGSTTTGLVINTTFGIMDSTADNGTHPTTEAAISGAVAMTVATSYAEGRQFLVNCTVAGNVSVTFADGSILVVPVPVGLTILPWAVLSVNTSGTTATATYASLK